MMHFSHICLLSHVYLLCHPYQVHVCIWNLLNQISALPCSKSNYLNGATVTVILVVTGSYFPTAQWLMWSQLLCLVEWIHQWQPKSVRSVQSHNIYKFAFIWSNINIIIIYCVLLYRWMSFVDKWLSCKHNSLPNRTLSRIPNNFYHLLLTVCLYLLDSTSSYRVSYYSDSL